jgi:hypothetical protein
MARQNPRELRAVAAGWAAQRSGQRRRGRGASVGGVCASTVPLRVVASPLAEWPRPRAGRSDRRRGQRGRQHLRCDDGLTDRRKSAPTRMAATDRAR